MQFMHSAERIDPFPTFLISYLFNILYSLVNRKTIPKALKNKEEIIKKKE